MEKIEIASNVTEQLPVATEAVMVKKENTATWLIDTGKGEKKCSACGAIMHGWAYREKLDYCPKCGAKMQ